MWKEDASYHILPPSCTQSKEVQRILCKIFPVWISFQFRSFFKHTSCWVERVKGKKCESKWTYIIVSKIEAKSVKCVLEIDLDIQQYLAAWKELKLLLQLRPKSPIDHTMGHLLFQWKARRIVDLLADWKVVKKGRSKGAFPCHFTNRWTNI